MRDIMAAAGDQHARADRLGNNGGSLLAWRLFVRHCGRGNRLANGGVRERARVMMLASWPHLLGAAGKRASAVKNGVGDDVARRIDRSAGGGGNAGE